METPHIIFILGRSGCGKGTQAKLLAENLRVDYIGSGDMLRARQNINDFTGRKINAAMDKTIGFAPTAIIFKLWVDRFEAMKDRSNFRGFIVDGSPRKIREAELIDETLGWFEWDEYSHVILIDVSREESFRRLTKRRVCQDCKTHTSLSAESADLKKCDKCGGILVARKDDTPEIINNRLDSFEEEVVPVIVYYEKSKRLIRINGEQSIKDVHRDIMKAVS
jgi:adenylate kinase